MISSLIRLPFPTHYGRSPLQSNVRINRAGRIIELHSTYGSQKIFFNTTLNSQAVGERLMNHWNPGIGLFSVGFISLTLFTVTMKRYSLSCPYP